MKSTNTQQSQLQSNMLPTWTIGNVEILNRCILAPMAGYGDRAFREMCRRGSAGLSCTEMISCKGLIYGNSQTDSMLDISCNETPSTVQLFGKDPQDFAKALQDSRLDKFDIIDINMGCPVNKVIKHGEGSGLMATPDVACDIVRTCVRHSNGRPVTVKHRLGIECGDNVAVEFGLRLQDAGASALAIHGRYQQQLYRGDNDWDSIGRVAQVVDIPVIGSGNIVDRQGYDTVMRDYPISAVMIGRAAIGNPRVFETILGNNIQQQPVDIMQLCRQHLQLHMQYNSAPNNIAIFKKHLSSYIARLKPHIEQLNCNVSHINDLKQQAHRLASEQQVYDLIDSVV